MSTIASRITVCVCTLNRSALLTRLLTALEKQRTDDLFTYAVVVVDNDLERSAEGVVSSFKSLNGMRITYCVEPKQNIALARNKALAHADGELIAFIDDDEIPGTEWLYCLFKAHQDCQGDGVLGPVVPLFEEGAPDWVIKGKFFDRPNHPTGYILNWQECRTGNVLFHTNILGLNYPPFRAEFGAAGEDMDFFRRMMEKGCVFSWSRDAVVHELIPRERCRRRFLLRRALLRGSNFPKHPANRLQNCLKSVLAVPSYALALPFLAVCGHHLFLRYLVKLCDHSSRLLAFGGWSVIKSR